MTEVEEDGFITVHTPMGQPRNHAEEIANAAAEYDRQCAAMKAKPTRKASIPVHSYIQGQYALKRAEVSLPAEPWGLAEYADAHAVTQETLEQETDQ